MENFYYVLDKPLKSLSDYQTMSSKEKGLLRLDIKGSVDSLLLVVTEINEIGTILPSGDGKGFGGTGPLYPGDRGQTVNEMANVISSKLTTWLRLYKGDPRAIVHADTEKDFIEAAEALGLKPVKACEEMFSEGFDS